MGRGLSGAILAAGRGDRLRAAVAGIPKPLVELWGEALLTRQVRSLITIGASPVHVIVNSETACLMNEWHLEMPEEVDLCVRDTPNSMESLLELGDRIAPGRFVLATVDAIVDRGQFCDFIRRAMEVTDLDAPRRLDGALGVVKWRGDKHPLFAEVAADGRIIGLGDKQTSIVTAGVYVFATEIFGYAAEARALGLDAMRRFLALLVNHGMRFAAIELDDVIDVDEGVDLGAAGAMLARRGDAGRHLPGTCPRARRIK